MMCEAKGKKAIKSNRKVGTILRQSKRKMKDCNIEQLV